MSEEDKEKELEEYRTVLIPLIRKIMPGSIAQDLVGVQPMSLDMIIPMETGISHEVDGEVEFFWVRPSQPASSIFTVGIGMAKHRAKTRNEQIMEWCYATYGPRGTWGIDLVNPNARWHASDQKFYFRNEADRTLFILRWE